MVTGTAGANENESDDSIVIMGACHMAVMSLFYFPLPRSCIFYGKVDRKARYLSRYLYLLILIFTLLKNSETFAHLDALHFSLS
jgi:hypothetical protein